MKLIVITPLFVAFTVVLCAQQKESLNTVRKAEITTLHQEKDGVLSPEEKSEIAHYMATAWDKMESSVRDLSGAQWSYKPADSVWSIAEICEHLEKSEIELFSLLTETLVTSEASPDKAPEVGPKTDMVMEAITSRQQRIKTRPNLEPTGKYASPEDFLKNFKVLREKTLNYSQQTEHALRHHFVPFGPLGDLDGYQILMFMSGHLERHSQQIDEVKGDPNYPPA